MSVAKSGWSTTKKISKDIKYTHKWSIENFDFAMGLGGGQVESDSFHIPGVLGEFQLVIDKNKFHTTNSTSLRDQKPTKLKLNDEEFEAKHYFSVDLTFTSVVKDLKAAGMLEIVKEGEESQWGKFGDQDLPTFVVPVHFTFMSYKTGLQYESILYHREGNFYPACGFFTTGSTGRLDLVATITIPGKLVTLGGGAEVEVKEMELFDFKPLLKDPKHSDVVLKCGDTRFLCHKVILAAR